MRQYHDTISITVGYTGDSSEDLSLATNQTNDRESAMVTFGGPTEGILKFFIDNNNHEQAIIFCNSDDISTIQKICNNYKFIGQVLPLQQFYTADEKHQHFFEKQNIKSKL
jgi:peptide methionine sulfoxide reductase MsrA